MSRDRYTSHFSQFDKMDLYGSIITTCLVSQITELHQPVTKQHIFRLVQIESICRQQNKCILEVGWLYWGLTPLKQLRSYCDAHVFPGFLTQVLTQLFFPKPPTTFLTCFCRGERQKYAGKKSCLNWGSNSQPPGLESNTLTTEPPGRGVS